ncbi:MAG TPA: SUMF1/EgtB/PvdO family nonheme iron enzyme [Anaerolineales bacterium]|nr:SUMF1/EgtB/PvdO family nonheme iron enzyme [Anaerolineales bacterium]
MARIFVSYNRKSTEFCKRLTGEMQKRDLDFWVDWEGIPPTVEWMKEIEKGIEEADTFLAIVTTEWITSKVCIDELNIAVKNGKRMIPVVPQDINWDDVPPTLAKFNFIFFTEKFDFNTQLELLYTALETDYDWLKTHRRLQVKALEWERSNKENGYLLRGQDLDEAESQISINANKDPRPTDLQHEYVLKSRQSATRQRRITTGVLTFIIVMLLGITAYLVTPLVLEAAAKERAMGEMITIPSGSAIIGTEEQYLVDAGFPPRQTIDIPAYQIGKYEITNYQYGECVNYGNCTVPADQTDFKKPEKEKYPIVNVTLYQANNYCHWLGQRLPTQVEWERAARGSYGENWPWGKDGPTSDQANMPWNDFVPDGLLSVDSLSLGTRDEIYNLVGNAWEWTSSFAEPMTIVDPTHHWDGTPENYLGTRDYIQVGGGWQFNIEEIALYNPANGTDARAELGFRCAASLTSSK